MRQSLPSACVSLCTMTKNLSEQEERQLMRTLKDMDGVIDLRHARRVTRSKRGLKVDHQALRRIEDEALSAVRAALPEALRSSLRPVAISARPFATRVTYVYAGERLCASIWLLEEGFDAYCEIRWAEPPRARPLSKPLARTRPGREERRSRERSQLCTTQELPALTASLARVMNHIDTEDTSVGAA